MELTKKTTILFSPELHGHLSALAAQRGTSLGELVRAACEQAYGTVSIEARVKAVDALGRLTLPVGTPEEMERESTPAAEESEP